MVARKRQRQETEDDFEEGSREVRDSWAKFRRGDHLPDEELRELIQDTENAMPFLMARPEFGIACDRANRDLMTLRDYEACRRDPMWKK